MINPLDEPRIFSHEPRDVLLLRQKLLSSISKKRYDSFMVLNFLRENLCGRAAKLPWAQGARVEWVPWMLWCLPVQVWSRKVKTIQRRETVVCLSEPLIRGGLHFIMSAMCKTSLTEPNST